MYKCWRNLSHDIESKHKNQFSGNNEAKPKFEVGSEQWWEVLHEGFCHCLAMSLEEKCFRTTTSVKVKRCTCPNRMNITCMLLHLTRGHCVIR